MGHIFFIKKEDPSQKGFLSLYDYKFLQHCIFSSNHVKMDFLPSWVFVYAPLIVWVKKILDDDSSSSLEDLNLKIGLGFWIWKDFSLKWMSLKHCNL